MDNRTDIPQINRWRAAYGAFHHKNAPHVTYSGGGWYRVGGGLGVPVRLKTFDTLAENLEGRIRYREE